MTPRDDDSRGFLAPAHERARASAVFHPRSSPRVRFLDDIAQARVIDVGVDLCGADVGIGITGIAGPGGGSAEKPVGRVHVAIAEAGTVWHIELSLIGDRELIRRRAASIALDRLRRRLLEDG